MLLAGDATSATAKPPIAQATVDYSRVLRAIGQDLTDLFPKLLEIENDGANFIARGHSHPNPFHQQRTSACKNVWHKLIGKKAEAEPIAFEPAALGFHRTYTPADIDRLDRLYSAGRTGQVGRPDSYSLAERLRVMGGIVDSRKGRLKQLRKNADQLFVDYWGENGEIHTAKLTTVIMYRNQQHEPSRSPAPKELWEGYDF
ncbi:MAG: hypothetical protein ACREQ2_28005 [Candidatus Binatia bacterium]